MGVSSDNVFLVNIILIAALNIKLFRFSLTIIIAVGFEISLQFLVSFRSYFTGDHKASSVSAATNDRSSDYSDYRSRGARCILLIDRLMIDFYTSDIDNIIT